VVALAQQIVHLDARVAAMERKEVGEHQDLWGAAR
jgi:hypothetical protein